MLRKPIDATDFLRASCKSAMEFKTKMLNIAGQLASMEGIVPVPIFVTYPMDFAGEDGPSNLKATDTHHGYINPRRDLLFKKCIQNS